MIDWGLDPQAAAALPHAVNRFGTYDLEEGTSAEGLAEGLGAIGYETSARALTSGLHLIAIGDRLLGGADPRREGIALGE
jgi:gamma-glutamyltranspeptidase/glutathione hydrolase